MHLTQVEQCAKILIMKHYPIDILEFENEFQTEEQCRDYLMKLRYPGGQYICPKCGSDESWKVTGTVFECKNCHHQSTVIAGTLFQDSRKPLSLWFKAIWYITSQKNGASALGLQKLLGLGSYRTAWTWLHKLRRAMIHPGEEFLIGVVEVGTTFISAPSKDEKRNCDTDNNSLIAVAVEVTQGRIGRSRMSIIENISSQNLHAFIKSNVEFGSTIVTGGQNCYSGLSNKGYLLITNKKAKDDKALPPHVYTVVSLLKNWLLGTPKGSYSKKYLGYYLDEYCFRFNRKNSKSRRKLFHRLLQNAVHMQPITDLKSEL